MTSYLGFAPADIVVSHEVSSMTTQPDGHGNYDYTYAPPVSRNVVSIYPLHKLPHHDIVGPEYVARTMIDFIMEVPDATVYKKNDRVTWNGMVFLVQGFPFNWGGNDPFGFDSTMFGGSVHIERVT